MLSQNSRLHYLDLLKFLSILGVIFYHCFTAPVEAAFSGLSQYVHYFAISCLSVTIPVFFLVNGGLLFQKPFDLKKHILRMVRILGLIVLWDILNVSIKALFLHKISGPGEFLSHLWHFDSGWSSQLWFLMALFVLYLFFPVFKAAYDNAPKSLIFFAGAAFLIIVGNHFLNVILHIGEFLLHMPGTASDISFFNQLDPFRGLYGFSFLYFLAGAFLLANVRKLPRIPFPTALGGFFTSMLFLTAYGVIRTRLAGAYFDTAWDGFNSVFTFAGVFFLFLCSLSYRYREGHLCSFIRGISANSLGIYLLQSILADLLRPLFAQTSFSQNLLLNFLFSFLMLCLCYLLVQIIKKIPVISEIITL